MKKILVTKIHKNQEIKSDCKKSTCVLAISVGQKIHEGENLAATIDYINGNFKNCIILLGDTIQRHNISFLDNIDSRNAYKKSLEYGNSWLLRNKPIYNDLKIPFQITRWDEWLNHENYKDIEEKLQQIYKDNINIQNSFKNTAEEFKTRFIKYMKEKSVEVEITKTLEEKIIKNSIIYLKEESVILTYILANEKYHYILYPSKILEAVKTSREILLKEDELNYAKWIDFTLERVNLAPEKYKDLLSEKYFQVEIIEENNTVKLKSKNITKNSNQLLFKNIKETDKILNINEIPFKTFEVAEKVSKILMDLSSSICLNKEKNPLIDLHFNAISTLLEKHKIELEKIKNNTDNYQSDIQEEKDNILKF